MNNNIGSSSSSFISLTLHPAVEGSWYMTLCYASASKMHTGLFHLYYYGLTTLSFYVFSKSLIMRTPVSVSGATETRIL